MVLHEKRVDFEVREVDLSNKSEEFLAANPTGKVPLIVVDGDSLHESNIIINQYLDEVTSEPKLMPEDPQAKGLRQDLDGFRRHRFLPSRIRGERGAR